MEFVIICFAALAGSALTLFSGFGLGTLMVPVFGIFFPLPLAIQLTAIVHFLNNLFKLILVGKNIDFKIALRFGLPGIVAAFGGAWLLTQMTELPALYSWNSDQFEITPVKLVIAVLIIFFSLFDLLPRFNRIEFDKKYLFAGGLLSGFFGGLSGNQGALRSAFLIRSGLSKEAFIATGVFIACLVDTSRLFMYSDKFIINDDGSQQIPLLVAATLSAFAGAYIGNKLVKKMTITFLQQLVGIMLIVFGLLLGIGII
jgi:uncharacterized membrane protein YfcA